MTNQNSLQNEKVYKCEECQDTEYIYIPETNSCRECKCKKINAYRRLIEKSGITRLFTTKTFDNFKTEGKAKTVQNAKRVAQDYVKNFTGIESLALLGESGSGKTHLCIAVSNELFKQNIGVLYMQYREVLTNIKQHYIAKDNAGDSIYQKEIEKYKAAPVLYIDDLYKGKISETDVNIMFELINHRYINMAPIIISSEMSCEIILQVDKAIGGRILEMCKGNIVEFDGITLNHRLI